MQLYSNEHGNTLELNWPRFISRLKRLALNCKLDKINETILNGTDLTDSLPSVFSNDEGN